MIVLILLLTFLLGFSACHSDRVSVNPKELHSPQYAYRLDELAMLQMMADDVQTLERKKQYGQIYDHYASSALQQTLSRRHFLIMANCAETYLGGVEEFDPNDDGFYRRLLVMNSGKKIPMDILNRNVQRTEATVTERMVFIPDNLNFKLDELSWLSKDKSFEQCMADSAQLEAQTSSSQTSKTDTTVSPHSNTSSSTSTNKKSSDQSPTTASTDASKSKDSDSKEATSTKESASSQASSSQQSTSSSNGTSASTSSSKGSNRETPTSSETPSVHHHHHHTSGSSDTPPPLPDNSASPTADHQSHSSSTSHSDSAPTPSAPPVPGQH